MLFRHQEETKINLYAENMYDASRSRRNSYQRVDPEHCTIWARLGHKCAITTEDTVLKFKFNLCFKIKPYLGLEIVNGVDNFVREAMPVQRGRGSFGETRCKGETNIKTVINKWLGLYSY